MTDHDPRDPQPTSDETHRDPQTPDPDERLHRYDPSAPDGTEQTAAVPPAGTWHREGRAASQEGASAGSQAGWEAPSAHSYDPAGSTGPATAPAPPVLPPPPAEHTSAFGPFTFRPDEPSDPAHVTRQERTRGRNRAAGVLVGALLLGSAGGVVGAAAYTAANGDQSPTGSLSAPTATVTTRTTSDDDSRTDSTDLPAAAGSAEAVAAKVLPSVVKINVSGSQGAGSGSGIILSSAGEILTNNHVTEIAKNGGRMTVSFNDGTTAPAKLVGDDPVTDLAVIKVDGVAGLTPAKLGDSDKLDVGEGVVAIGSPFGLQATVTSGIVSALNRPVSVGGDGGANESTTYPAIQTDAAINPGNSGGPLVNLAGQVVGINSSIRSSSDIGGEGGSIGLGFAIPISKVLPVVDQLRNGQSPTHARLGITVSDKGSSTDPTDNGLITGAGVEQVTPGSAGDKAGLEAGDVVTKVDDEPISSSESLVATIRGYRPGDKVTLTILRDGKTQTLDATLDSDVASTTS
ncbi:S1C family serine protease [Nocardioides marmoribigeumensis]|uniref:Serine protease PepD n=1 Tax=Nocardioides marmoribigeumensis TaxID=433649 RepID=A0ABU2BVV0_9ACTN|nr:trypsin-like peptidase domain-containing protein [Nocardioides marmoribigeumensis]MDR7362755.1 putative serine protease PepD [Nocardioides marmoribigeumensis]